jgi:protoporphyrinogen oxidase
MRVGIVGGGLMGLALAHYLARAGGEVEVLEKEGEVGGLARSALLLPDLRWDRYYHVILSTDSELLAFLEELGLSPQVAFSETRTGFFSDGELHSLSSTMEFLRFKPLSLGHKLRLAAGILYASRLRNWSRLERLYARTWLVRVFGRRIYEKLWDPLLRSKLGEARQEAAASFIWATIRRYYGTRHNASKRELMGCVRGGYHSVLGRLQEELGRRGVAIRLGQEVRSVESLPGGGLRVHCPGGSRDYERLVLTVPNPVALELCPGLDGEYARRLASVRYLGLVCVTLVLRRRLCPFYVTNLTDPGFPFTGVIEAANVVPEEVLGGRGLVYLPRYTAPGDPLAGQGDEEILESFLRGLSRIFPELEPQDILARAVSRERHVQPLQDQGYSSRLPSFDSPLPGLHLVNTTMIRNSTLNNNRVVELARAMAEHLLNGKKEES